MASHLTFGVRSGERPTLGLTNCFSHTSSGKSPGLSPILAPEALRYRRGRAVPQSFLLTWDLTELCCCCELPQRFHGSQGVSSARGTWDESLRTQHSCPHFIGEKTEAQRD